MKSAHPRVFDSWELSVMMTRNTLPPTARGVIVESELLDILQTVIEARCGLSAIHHLLDGAQTMSDIHARFAQWETNQHAVRLQSTSNKPNKPENEAMSTASRTPL